MTTRKKPKLPTHGSQVVIPLAGEDPTNFEEEFVHPRVYLDNARASRFCTREERKFLSAILPNIGDHVFDWFVEEEGQTADEAAQTFFGLLVPLQRAFVRAFLPQIDEAQRKGIHVSVEDITEMFRRSQFKSPTRTPSPLAWVAAKRVVDPYIGLPFLRKVRIVP